MLLLFEGEILKIWSTEFIASKKRQIVVKNAFLLRDFYILLNYF